MNADEILDKRIKNAKRLYGQELESALLTLKWEIDKLNQGLEKKSMEVAQLTGLTNLIKRSTELNALLALKDQIENQER